MQSRTQGSDDKIVALIDHAFRKDNDGNLSVWRVYGLTRLAIKDDGLWDNAMNALKDALIPDLTKQYLRFYRRVGEEQKWQAIMLNLSAL